MTLVIYKNNVFAADSRTSNRTFGGHKCKGCPECGTSLERLVNDGDPKINLIDKEKVYLFRKDRILAYAGAGEVKMIEAFKNIIDKGLDIDETFNTFALLHIRGDVPTVSIILVGVKKVWHVWIEGSPRLQLKVEITDREGTAFLGSGSDGYHWIEHLTGGVLPPQDMISLIKTKEQNVGGDIHYVDFNQADPVIKTLDETDVKFTLQAARIMTKSIMGRKTKRQEKNSKIKGN